MTALTIGQSAGASWWSRSVADDADLTVMSGGRSVPPPPEPGVMDTAQKAATRVVDGGVGIASSGASALMSVGGMLATPFKAVGASMQSASQMVGQFAWEVAYVFGANGTPVNSFRTGEPELIGLNDQIANGRAPGAPPPPNAAQDKTVDAAPAPTAQPVAASATPPVVDATPVAPVAAPAAAEPTPPVLKPTPTVAGVETASEPLDPKLFTDFVFDKARRRSDGSFFVPKPLQRLFDMRTQKVETAKTALSVQLPGRIIPDPNAHGDVETSLIGRIEAPKTGLPVLGDTVKEGQVLGYVTPSVGVVDRTQVRREVARLTNEIRITAESLELMKQFWFVPFRDGKIIQSEMRLEGLRRERSSLLPMLQTQEVLRASTDGVISVSNAINGRIVHPGEKIFEIVNPNRLWVEAIAADPDVAKTAAAVDAAVAMTPEGQTLDIGFVGSGLALQQQAVPLMFRIDKPIPGLRVGRPVTVAIRSKQTSRSGIAVPRDAVVVGSSGLEQVWEHVAPEVFVPRTVKTEPIDGRSVLITAGLTPGAQIVTQGTRLLIQLQ
ncbi:HlyD family efflux transporter periplasmic adaptor subunit [Azospirillum sp.]|uniref:efflux RND transporter periplasmic adaptor subunit n=1 Tax=Azospirillum sp. TaxID=34012 RepID=UPI0026335B94|nr:HlyD family efflux transporter periplasmic adaptor subunit [Azospirillum sp.]